MLILQKAIQQSEEKELTTQNELANVIRIVSPFFVHCFVSYKNYCLCLFVYLVGYMYSLEFSVQGPPPDHGWLSSFAFSLGILVKSMAGSVCPGSSSQEHGRQ